MLVVQPGSSPLLELCAAAADRMSHSIVLLYEPQKIGGKRTECEIVHSVHINS